MTNNTNIQLKSFKEIDKIIHENKNIFESHKRSNSYLGV